MKTLKIILSALSRLKRSNLFKQNIRKSGRDSIKGITCLLVIGTLLLATARPTQAQTSSSDSLILVQLYNKLSGSNWNNKTNWLSDEPVGTWYGIQVDENGNVTNIKMENNNLSGSIPPEIGNLTNLIELWISDNKLTGSIPPEIGNLANLGNINLVFNQLTGSIPPEIGNLTNLTELNFDFNQLTSIPPEIGNLANLSGLRIGENRLTSIPPEIGNLTNLTYLGLEENQLTFEDVEPNVGHFEEFMYSPQDVVGKSQVKNIAVGASVNLSVSVDGTANQYQWYKDGSAISGANSSTYTIASATAASAGIYICHITNTIATDLTLHSGPITVKVGGSVVPTSDLLTLVQLYDELGGPNWTNNDNWLSDEPLEDWYGIEVDENGNVTSIILENNNLSGSIPPEIGNLTNLGVLRLEKNQLTGSIPLEIGNLTNLTNLRLYNNQLSGTIPPEIGNLNNMTYLSLGGNQLTGSIPLEIGNLANLQDLRLYNNQLNGTIPPEIWNLNNLTNLSLNRNQLTGSIPTEIGNLNNLTYLNLGVNKLTGSIPLEIGNLANLENLRLEKNKLTGSIPLEIGNLANLTVLGLWYNQLTGSIPPEIGNLTNLTNLSLEGNQLLGSIPTEIGNLANLKQLWLYGNQLTGSIPPEIGNLANLTEIHLHTNQLTGSIPPEIGNLANLTQLQLYNNPLKCNIPPEIGKLTNLKFLNLSANQLTGSIPPEIGNLNNLIGLWLHMNQLTGSIPPEIGNLNNLIGLDLNDNQLTGSIPPEIGNLNSMEDIRLERNQLTGSIPPEIGNLNNLTQLQIYENQLTGSIPPEIGNLSNLTYLQLHVNQLTGSIPPEIGNLTNLTDLWLRANQLTGSIPLEIGNLTNLTGIWLGDNQLTGNIPPEIGNINNMTGLDLGSNQLTGSIPPEIGNLTNLTGIWLGGNQLTGNIPPEIGNLTNLTNPLDLSFNQLTGSIPPEIGNLANLTFIHFYDNQLTGSIPPEIGNLTNLENLQLGDNQLTGSIPKEIGNLTNLTEIILCANQLTGSIPPEIGNLANLTGLNFVENQLTGSIPLEIGNLNNLLYLHLFENQLTGSIPLEIGNMTNLTDLSLNHNQLTGSIPPEVGNLNNLTILSLYENQLSGSIPTEISNLNNLIDLDLDANQLTGSIPPEIGNINNLQKLRLGGNQLTGSIPPEIWNLTNLTKLLLWDNQLTGSIPPEIGNLTNMVKLMLSGNQLTGSIPPEVGNLTNMEELLLYNNQLTGSIPPEIGNLTNMIILALHDNQLTGSIPPEIGNLTNLIYLVLGGNQLTGSIPTEIGNLINLQRLFLNKNQFTDLPVLSSLESLDSLKVEDNKLTFEDIEPNVGHFESFIYSPQDSVGKKQVHSVDPGTSITLSVSVDGTANKYQWFRNSIPISNATGSEYTIGAVDESTAGKYTCQITNTIATELTLYSRPMIVAIELYPIITGISPIRGFSDEDIEVRISGKNFQPGLKITIGTAPFDVIKVEFTVTDLPVKIIIPAGSLPVGTYDVQVMNPDGKVHISKIYRFTIILPGTDIMPPVFVLRPRDVSVTKDAATIEWTTNELTRGTVYYGTTTAYTDSVQDITLTELHSVTLDSLIPETEYNYRVSIIDSAGNGPVYSRNLTFITAAEKDTIPPVIVEGPFVEGIRMNSAAVIWHTDEPATSDLGYRVSGSDEPYKEINLEILTLKHVVPLFNLSSDTGYEYRIYSIDAFGNTSDTLWGSFHTKAVKDTIAPILVNPPVATGITDISARIIWVTNEISDSYVEYGLTTDYEYPVYDSTFVRYHSIFLPDLEPKTEYHYRIRSTDRSDNTLIGIDRTFTTKAEKDTIPPFITEGPAAVEITQNSAKIVWKTDELSDSYVQLIMVTAVDTQKFIFSNPEPVLEHAVPVTGLFAGRRYVYNIWSKDADGNKTILRGSSFKTLAEADVTPPRLISGPVLAGIGHDYAIIEWKTDENSTSEVYYAIDSAKVKESEPVVLTERVKLHYVKLTGLQAETFYYYMIRSVDVNGNVLWGPLRRFRTKSAPDITPPVIIEGPVVTEITINSAIILWKTNELATSVVSFNIESDTVITTISSGDLVKNHYVMLTGLASNTKYVYRIKSEDGSNNISSEVTDTFKTKLKFIVIKPIITNGPIVISRTHNSATIKWITNKLSNSIVEYDTTLEIGQIEVDVSNVKEHNITLTNLFPLTTYFYRVLSIDQSRDTVSSKINEFITRAAPDTLPPVVLTGPIVIGRTKTKATIKWKTDEPSDSRVEYGTTETYDMVEEKSEHKLTHLVRLTNLIPGTEYHYSFSSTDLSGNTFISSDFTFTTRIDVDEKPPIILARAIVAAKTHNSATIVWGTDEPSDSYVKFGLDTTLQELEEDASDVKEHNIILTNLTADTLYYFKVRSTDVSGNTVESRLWTFKTLTAPDTVAPIIAAGPEEIGKTDVKVIIRWKTDELADGYVEFGETEAYGDITGAEKYSKEHIIPLTNLTPDTEYHYKIISTDITGNKYQSEDFSFKTKKEIDNKPPVILKGPIVKNRTYNTATIVWVTDEVSDGFVYFGTDTSSTEIVGHEEDITFHSISLTNLSPSTMYYYKVKSEDPSGNYRFSSFFKLKTKAEPDTIKPRLTRRPNAVNRTYNTVTIVWETDELSDSYIEFSTDSTNLDQTVEDAEKVSTHSLLLTNLSSSTRYYYRARSIDLNGNSFTGAIQQFVTRAAPDTIPPVILEGPIAMNVTYNSTTIVWETDERTSSFVEFSTDSTSLGNKTGSADLLRVGRVSLTNLEPNTLYYVAVISQDISRNEVNTRDRLYAFYTKAVPDTLPPDIIEGPIVARTTENSAVIKWKTNEQSNTIVEFGTDMTYSEGPVSNEENVRNHKIILTNLLSATEYFAYVRSIDLNGNVIETRDTPISFRTKKEKDRKKPKVIRGPIVTNLISSESSSGKILSSATIEWTTDEPSDGFVVYGFRKDSMIYSEGSSELTIDHFVNLTNLIPGEKYFYVVNSTDIDGNKNEKTRIINRILTPVAADTTRPFIVEGPIVFTTERSASFEWVTDEPSNSIIYYGIADSIESGTRYEKFGTADLVTKHNVVITNLLLGEEYIFVITSSDRSNNVITFPTKYVGSLYRTLEEARTAQPPGGTGRFTTSSTRDDVAPIIISGPTVANKSATNVTIEWVTDEQSNSIVEYGISEDYTLSKQSASNVVEHSVILTNLEPSTTYNYQVSSTDINQYGPSLSLNSTVTTDTETDIIPPQIIAGPVVTSITDDQATILWETDEPSDTYIEFTLDSTFGELDTISGLPEIRTLAEDVTSHRITLTNLLPDTIYYFRAASVDLEDNGPTFSADKYFRTYAIKDVIPPQIIDGPTVVSTTDRTATIRWTTDELSDSFVMFSDSALFQKRSALRKVTNYYENEWENNVGSAKDVTEHEITLTNLEPDVTYIYAAGSTDKSDNTTYAPDIGLFKTSASPDTTPPEVPEILFAVGGNNEVYIQWTEVPNAAGDLGGYNIYRRKGLEEDYISIATQIKDRYYYDRSVTNDTSYAYSISSMDNVYPPNESVRSEPYLVKPSADYVPTAPIILSPVNNAMISNTLRPTFSVRNSMTILEPQYYTGPLTYTFAVAYDSTFLNLASYKTDITEGENTTSYAPQTDLENYTKYYWRARSNDGIFNSVWSETGKFYLDVPVNIQLAVFTGKTIVSAIQLDWETVSENGNAGFNIYRSLSPDYGFEKINFKLIPSSGDMKYTFEDKNVEPGKTYYYKLESVNILGITEQYEVLQVTVMLPKEFVLHQNYPNPFNPYTKIEYQLPKITKVILKIFNILGQEIKTLINQEQKPGNYQIMWDGTNNLGIKVSSGIYLYQLKADGFVQTKKMTFLK